MNLEHTLIQGCDDWACMLFLKTATVEMRRVVVNPDNDSETKCIPDGPTVECKKHVFDCCGGAPKENCPPAWSADLKLLLTTELIC